MGNFLVKISNLEQFGGIYNNEISIFLTNILNKFYEGNPNFDKFNFDNLGGVYFIRDFNITSEEYYKIGLGTYLSDKKLIGRINSYGTYYPFGIRIRGICFTLINSKINRSLLLKDLKYDIIDFHLLNNNLAAKKNKIEYYKNKYLQEQDLTEEYYKNKILYTYCERTKDYKLEKNEKYNFNTLKDIITDLYSIGLEKEIGYQIKTNFSDSYKSFKNYKIWTRDNFGEFFKIKTEDLLNTYLQIDNINNQLLIYFPDKELIFGEYNTTPNKGKDFEVYLGSNLIMKDKFP